VTAGQLQAIFIFAAVKQGLKLAKEDENNSSEST
jgi:hypothetical protein